MKKEKNRDETNFVSLWVAAGELTRQLLRLYINADFFVCFIYGDHFFDLIGVFFRLVIS